VGGEKKGPSKKKDPVVRRAAWRKKGLAGQGQVRCGSGAQGLFPFLQSNHIRETGGRDKWGGQKKK